MKPFFASLLALLVFHQALTAQAPQATDFAEMAKALGIGTKVEVQLVGGSHIRGRISAVQPDALSVYVGRPNAGKVRTLAFTNIVTLKRQPATHTPLLAWAVAGAIVAAVVIAISVLLIERRNESGLIQMPGDFRTDHVTAQARAKDIHMSGNSALGEVRQRTRQSGSLCTARLLSAATVAWTCREFVATRPSFLRKTRILVAVESTT